MILGQGDVLFQEFRTMIGKFHHHLDRITTQPKAEMKGETGVRRGIRDLCEVMGIEWTAERDADVRKMGAARLEALRKGLVKEKSWPD